VKFWDSSALIPLFVNEPATSQMEELAKEDDRMVVWWGSMIECWSATARLRRENLLTAADEDNIRSLLLKIARAWTEIQPGERVRSIAGRLLLGHPLRAADSLQLGAALVWAGTNPAGHQFVCLDQRLRDAARKEGFQLSPVFLDGVRAP
jgi:predicted nucleic acid-binding protein